MEYHSLQLSVCLIYERRRQKREVRAVDVEMTKFFKALSDPTRYKIFLLLLERHHCSRSLAPALGISEPAVSQHMAVLKDCGLVVGVRHCRHIHYVVDERVLAAALSQMGGWIQASRTACDCQGRDRCAFCERCGLSG